jgi:hypothetical protein
MPVEIIEFLERLRAGVQVIPPVIIAIVLLAGPTVLWLLFRFVVQPRSARQRAGSLSAMWVCPRCRSVNELRLSRCYRCDAKPEEAELEVIESDPSVPGTLQPVGPGPGLDLGGPEHVMARRDPMLTVLPGLADDADGSGTIVPLAPAKRRRKLKAKPIAVGPGKPAVARPRRAIVAGGGGSRGPDDPTVA